MNFLTKVIFRGGYAVVQLVVPLRYKPEGGLGTILHNDVILRPKITLKPDSIICGSNGDTLAVQTYN